MIGAALLVFAQAGAAGWASARPAECAPLESSSAGNVWERAKSPSLRHYCDLLAGGAAKLATGDDADDAREALALAEEAARVLPGRAAPAALRGRALARLRRWDEAEAALAAARAQDPRALDDAGVLLAWGRALARRGKLGEAEAAYRALLPRASTLGVAERGMAEIEAALLAETRGPAGLDEAISALRQARRDAQDALQAVASYALALALDRAGEHDESNVILAAVARRDVRGAVGEPHARETLADAGALAEADALEALAMEVTDPRGARELWGRYLAGPGGKGPWAEHARAHQGAGSRPRGAP